jgi:hypothetical protein
MSGAANRGAYGNPEMGQAPWDGARKPPEATGWPLDYFGLWSLSRPLLIAATITGFFIWWPVGLALLFVSIWNKRVGRWAFGRQSGFQGCGPAAWAGRKANFSGRAAPSSGNSAFDEYRAETLRRLEEEQGEFSGFLDRLRFAKDKAEFDQFMAERRNAPPSSEPSPPPE